MNANDVPSAPRRETVIDAAIAEALTVYTKALNKRQWAIEAVERKGWRADEELAEATTALAHAGGALKAAEDKYEGWSRFFIVNNAGGHIHSTMSCSTCYPTTSFGWLPELSALTEADAVNEWGEILCTICFPDAPVAWTNGENKKTAADKAFNKAIAAVMRTPEGKKVKTATELVARKTSTLSQCQALVERLQENIDEYSDNDGYNNDGDRDTNRITQEQARIAKTTKELTRAQTKLDAATAALETALNA